MLNDFHISLLDLVSSVSNAIDLVSPEVARHHTRVAYTALGIAREMRLPGPAKRDLILAGLLHDIGMLSEDERGKALAFDGDTHDDHAETGYLLLRKFRHFEGVAKIIRYHHASWAKCRDRCQCKGDRQGCIVPRESHILHLADRVDVLMRSGPASVLDQAGHIAAAISHESGDRFDPQAVEAFMELAGREYFWLDLVSSNLDRILNSSAKDLTVELDWDDMQDFAELMAHVIDFRSRFTATHSSGVAAVGTALASLAGFSEAECEKIRIAGYLHDIGKLAIPNEILNKPGRLNDTEYRIIKTHAYHTRRILEHIAGLEDIVTWAAHHHERLDGNGYPGRHPGHLIPLGSRIIAVADLFTALSETRPYRKPKERHEVVAIMNQHAERQVLDARIVALVLRHYEDLNRYRQRAQDGAAEEYEMFRDSLYPAGERRAGANF